VLSTARDYQDDMQGVGITTLLRKANLSYARLLRILHDLVSSGLLDEIPQERGNRYKINARGLQFLQAYGAFEEFAESFGLRL